MKLLLLMFTLISPSAWSQDCGKESELLRKFYPEDIGLRRSTVTDVVPQQVLQDLLRLRSEGQVISKVNILSCSSGIPLKSTVNGKKVDRRVEHATIRGMELSTLLKKNQLVTELKASDCGPDFDRTDLKFALQHADLTQKALVDESFAKVFATKNILRRSPQGLPESLRGEVQGV
jgi:hypothetical protein